MIFNKIRNKFQLKFKDRASAANILGEALKDLISDEKGRQKYLVLGIPRGGVIIADVIARKLSCEFGVVISRKLCAPHNRELAIGAIVEDGTTYLNELIVTELKISPEYIENEKFRQLEEIKKMSSLYCSDNKFLEYAGNITFNNRNIILADDGAVHRVYNNCCSQMDKS